MTPTILLATSIAPWLEEALRQRYRVLGPATERPVADMPAEEREAVRAYVTLGTVGMTAETMGLLPALGLVCCRGSGVEKVDLGAARARGIQVANGVGANAASVADQAIALALASIRRVVTADAHVRAGRWQAPPAPRFPLVRGMTGRRVGILGLGSIGERIARRADAFETEVGYCNRRPRTDVGYRYFPDAGSLAEWADLLILAARADQSNRQIVDRRVLEALGPEGHVVNIARGSLIDEDALVRALETGTIAGAALDVFETEPVVRPDLLAQPNLVVAPHCGGGTIEAQRAMGETLLLNLDAFFAEGRPRFPVSAALDQPRTEANA